VVVDRPLARVAARGAVLAAVVLVATVPVYVWVEPSWRPLVARLASAFVLGVAFVQFRRVFADRIADSGDSALDAARDRRGPGPSVPHHFLDLASHVRAALRSRRHFERTLWPRLQSLTARPLVRPPVRRGRGPSLANLRAVIAAIEKQP
jgi:hypothetical protein